MLPGVPRANPWAPYMDVPRSHSGPLGPRDAGGKPVMPQWTLFEQDFRAIDQVLTHLLEKTSALSVHLVDRSGQLITTAGNVGHLDVTAFASLVAADFTANAELSMLLGDRNVDAVVNEGKNRSVHSCLIADRVIMCTVFDPHTTLGLVRYRAQRGSDGPGASVPCAVRQGRCGRAGGAGFAGICGGSRARGRRPVRRLTAYALRLPAAAWGNGASASNRIPRPSACRPHRHGAIAFHTLTESLWR